MRSLADIDCVVPLVGRPRTLANAAEGDRQQTWDTPRPGLPSAVVASRIAAANSRRAKLLN